MNGSLYCFVCKIIQVQQLYFGMRQLQKRYEYFNCILNNPKIKLVIKINMQKGRIVGRVIFEFIADTRIINFNLTICSFSLRTDCVEVK